MQKPKKLRAHHLLCIPQYRGKGYSGGFCEELGRIRQQFLSGEGQVSIVSAPDAVCRLCPNRTGSGCALDNNKVEGKDIRILQRLGLAEGEERDINAVFARAGERIDREFFEASCGQCRWYAQGLCSYEFWKECLDDFL